MSSNKDNSNFPGTNRKLPILAILFILVSSCVTQSKVELLQDIRTSPVKFSEAELPDYRLKSNDELFIRVNSLDAAATDVFSNASAQVSMNAGTIQPYGASLLSYSIDKDGYLLLPVLGQILVKDKTLSEVSVLLKDSLSHVLSQPIVTVKLVNRYVSVLGEVNAPGHFPFAQDKLTVFDAISLAGDVTDYGNRNEVILIRNENNENVRVSIDLTKSEILSSSYYNLRPNDIVYVKPLRKKFWGMRQFPFSVVLSSITTALLIYNYIK